MVIPSGNVVAPSGKRPPTTWATYATSSTSSATDILLHSTGLPIRLDTTAAVSECPIADITSAGISEAEISSNVATAGAEIIWMENAFVKYFIFSPFFLRCSRAAQLLIWFCSSLLLLYYSTYKSVCQ